MSGYFIDQQPTAEIIDYNNFGNEKMALTTEVYKASCEAEKFETIYEWSLRDWSLLYDVLYSKGIKSPNFFINGTTSQCALNLQSTDSGYHHNYGASLSVEFQDQFDYKVLKITVSTLIKTDMVQAQAKTTISNASLNNAFSFQFSTSFEPETIASYLQDDTLVLIVKIIMVRFITVDPNLSRVNLAKELGKTVRRNLKDLLHNESLTDVAFIIGDEKFLAHKVILAAHSDVFHAMFVSGMKEEKLNKVEIVDAEPAVFEQFLNYVYSAKVDNLETIAHKLIILADKYQVCELKTLCGNYLSSTLNQKNVVEYLIIAEKLNCIELKNKALGYIKTNTQVLGDSTNYEALLNYPTLIKEVFGK